MSRLFDDVFPKFRFSLPTRPIVVDITNVANYWAMHEQDEWDLGVDFPNLAPPLDLAFYEWGAPRSYLLNGKRYMPNDIVTRSGVLVQVIGPKSIPDFISRKGLVEREGQDGQKDYLKAIKVLASKSNWLITCVGFFGTQELFQTAVGVDPQGRLVKFSENYSHRILGMGTFANPEFLDTVPDMVAGWLHPLFLATSFMHCKNVVRKENTPPPKVQARRVKEDKLPLTKYYTLEIEAMKRTLQSEGGVSTNGLKKALHICRGHFATYSADKPLFGHYVGTVWKPQHVKGSKAAGEIVKDYAVKGPKVTP